MRPIGLHVRVTDSILDAAAYAHQLDIPIFQCFLVNQSDRTPLHINQTTAEQFKAASQQRQFYVHGSYWINLAQMQKMVSLF